MFKNIFKKEVRNVNVVIGYPPNYEEIKKHFDLKKDTIFTYGETIYNPDNGKIDLPLMMHELVHVRQQHQYGVEKWWSRYLRDMDFRLSQEVEAYQVQYKEGKRVIKDRNQQARFLSVLASALSGKMYGDIISYSEALKAIREERIYKFAV